MEHRLLQVPYVFEVVQNKVTGEFLPGGDDMHPSNSRLTKGSQYRRFAVILPRPYDVLGLKRKWIESSFKVNEGPDTVIGIFS